MAVRKKRKKIRTAAQVNNARQADTRSFEAFVKEHNAAIADSTIAEDFVEKHLIKMRCALGVAE